MPTTNLPNAKPNQKVPVSTANPPKGQMAKVKNVGLDINQARFIVGVSSATKIDPRVIIAWVRAEGAYAQNGTGHFNYLNLRPYPGDPYSGVSSGNFEQFSNVNDAIKATVRRLNQPFARPIIAMAASKPTPKQQIQAIAASGWDAGHYGGSGGIKLQEIFGSLFGGNKGLNDSYVSPASAFSIASTVGTGSAADAASIDSGTVDKAGNSLIQHIPGVTQAESIANAISWVGNNKVRIGLVVGGGIILLLGILSLFKAQTANFISARQPNFK